MRRLTATTTTSGKGAAIYDVSSPLADEFILKWSIACAVLIRLSLSKQIGVLRSDKRVTTERKLKVPSMERNLTAAVVLLMLLMVVAAAGSGASIRLLYSLLGEHVVATCHQHHCLIRCCYAAVCSGRKCKKLIFGHY